MSPTNKWNVHPSKWWCITNLKMYSFNKWIYFKDLPSDLFCDIWYEIERRPNLILNGDATAFKKTRWINFNRLNQNVVSYCER